MPIKLKGGKRQQLGRLKLPQPVTPDTGLEQKKGAKLASGKEPKISLQYRSIAAVDFAQPSFEKLSEPTARVMVAADFWLSEML